VKRWHKEWLAGELFENLPTDGIVVKVASGATKQKLGVTSKCPNWAIALRIRISSSNDKKERLFAPLLIIPFNPAKIAVFLFRDGEWSE